jgi:glycosyltransferase involved in cell wall biosynthesis
MYLPATEWGGPTYAIANYVDALTRAGVECEVFATTARGSLELPQVEPGTHQVRGIPVTYFRAASVKQSLIAPALIPALARRMREFDLLHTHMMWSFPGIVASRVARVRRVPYVITPHGSLDPWSLQQRPWMKRAFLLASENHTLREAALVHFTAEAERAAIPEQFRKLRSAVVANVIDPDAIAPREPRDSCDILILGRIHLVKGFDLLIPAMRVVVAAVPQARLVIAGPDEGGYRREVERMIAAAGVGNAVQFAGHVNLEERARLFSASALLVQPSHHESFGMACAEGMAAELPVVVTDRVNICDDISSAGAGLVVPPESAALAGALVELLRDPARRREMGQRGRRLVARRYAPGVVGAEMRRAYELALTPRG